MTKHKEGSSDAGVGRLAKLPLCISYREPAAIFSWKPKSRDQLRDTALIALDANVLLCPYMLPLCGMVAIEHIYKMLADQRRLVIPGWAAREYARQRQTKITEFQNNLSTSASRLSDVKFPSLPVLETLEDYKKLQEIRRKLHNALQEYATAARQLRTVTEQWRLDDPVSEIYRRVFTSEIIFDVEVTEELVSDLTWRNESRIPPGYKDQSKSENSLGDQIIWQTLLKVGKEKRSDMIFVTREEKSDWWHSGSMAGKIARNELVEEYRRETDGSTFDLLILESFLEMFGASF